jgi:hypothetical protein
MKKLLSKLGGAGKPGSALVLTMFILAGMLIVAMSGAYVVFLGIKAGSIQAQSTKAYYAAEAGAERLLWELRQGGYSYDDDPGALIFQGTLQGGGNYDIYFMEFPPLVFRSIGEYQNSKRSVEIRI